MAQRIEASTTRKTTDPIIQRNSCLTERLPGNIPAYIASVTVYNPIVTSKLAINNGKEKSW